MKTAVRYALGSLLLFVFFWTYWADLYDGIANVSFTARFFVICFVLWTLLYASQSALSQQSYRIFGIHVPFRELFGLQVISSVLSLIAPMGISTIVKACYLNVRYQLRAFKFSKIQLFMAATIYYVYLAAFCGALVHEFTSRTAAGCATFLVLLAVFPFGYALVQKTGWFTLPPFDRKMFFYALSNDTFYIILLGVVVRTAVRSDVSVSGVIVWAAIVQFSTIINLTPGNVGLREWMMAISSPVASLDHGEGATVSLLLRLVSVLSMLLWYPLSYKVLFIDQQIKFSDLIRKQSAAQKNDHESQSSKAA